MKELSISVADICLNIKTVKSELDFNIERGIKNYITNKEKENAYEFSFGIEKKVDLAEYKLVFVADLESNEKGLNFRWKVYQLDQNVAIEVVYNNHPKIKHIVAYLNPVSKNIQIKIVPLSSKIEKLLIDPLIHPMGSLLLWYLMHWNNAILIHSSGVTLNGKSFLFSGVSGIGKSTMARLWRECGADVLNDDRLIVKKVDGNVKVYNNPMPYYQQEPKEGILNGIFLLKQAKYNYIKKVEGVQAFTRLLANCIQQFYEPSMIKKHLALLEGIVQCVPVYEVGFVPTHDIVRDILKYTADGCKE